MLFVKRALTQTNFNVSRSKDENQEEEEEDKKRPLQYLRSQKPIHQTLNGLCLGFHTYEDFFQDFFFDLIGGKSYLEPTLYVKRTRARYNNNERPQNGSVSEEEEEEEEEEGEHRIHCIVKVVFCDTKKSFSSLVFLSLERRGIVSKAGEEEHTRICVRVCSAVRRRHLFYPEERRRKRRRKNNQVAFDERKR